MTEAVKLPYRRLFQFALVGTTVCFAAASYAREGTSPLAVLPTLLNGEPWLTAWIPLAIAAVTFAFLALGFASRNAALLSERTLLIQAAATCAAIATYSYDVCQDIGLSWLPTFGGCHCWLTGAAALVTACLTTLLLYLLTIFSVHIIRQICEHFSRYVHRIRLKAHAGRTRRVQRCKTLVARVRFIAFRGPPPFPIAVSFLRS